MTSASTFTNNGPFSFPNDTPTVYTMAVSGIAGPLAGLSFKINELTHPDFLFLHFLLIAPDGQSNLLVFDRSGTGVNVTNQSFLFTDHPEDYFPVGLGFTPLLPVSGDDIHGSDFGYPNLSLNYTFEGSTIASAFNGIDPNGTWTLAVLDDGSTNPGGSFTSWELNVAGNVAPTVSAPARIGVDAGSSITFSDANGNLSHSSDPDFVTGNFLILSMTTEHGTIENNSFGIGYAPTKSIALGSSVNDIAQKYLDGAVYRPDAGFTGVDHLTIQVADRGYFHEGAEIGSLSVTKTIDIEVFDHKTGTGGNDSYTASGWQKIDGGAGKDTVTFDFGLTQAIVTYRDNTVTIEGPNSKTVMNGIEKFVFSDGTVDNADGSPLVDDLYYYTTYHDIWAARIDPEQHFASLGWHEGRNPNAFFDTAGYLTTYADVRAAGVNPLEHYDTFGWKEGRNPSDDFGTRAYLQAYPDVAAAHVDPLAHFLEFGAQEGRHAFALA